MFQLVTASGSIQRGNEFNSHYQHLFLNVKEIIDGENVKENISGPSPGRLLAQSWALQMNKHTAYTSHGQPIVHTKNRYDM